MRVLFSACTVFGAADSLCSESLPLRDSIDGKRWESVVSCHVAEGYLKSMEPRLVHRCPVFALWCVWLTLTLPFESKKALTKISKLILCKWNRHHKLGSAHTHISIRSLCQEKTQLKRIKMLNAIPLNHHCSSVLRRCVSSSARRGCVSGRLQLTLYMCTLHKGPPEMSVHVHKYTSASMYVSFHFLVRTRILSVRRSSSVVLYLYATVRSDHP